MVNPKNWGGNLTRQGADTTAVLASILRTVHHQHLDPIAVLARVRTTGSPPEQMHLGRAP